MNDDSFSLEVFVVSQGINRFRADLRDIRFRLFEQFKLGDLLGTAAYAEWGAEECNMVIDELYKFVCDRIGPLNSTGDAEGCKFENGAVSAPTGFKEAWDALHEAGYRSVATPEEFGGQGAPFAMHAVVEEMLSGANCSFNMYPGLAHGAAEVLMKFGTDEQKKQYVEKILGGTWGGTMCLTEPQAGSDVGASTTKALKQDDGSYLITGTKIYISAGDHDMTENIIHLVLARTPDAAPGTKGLSLFIVPRDTINADGSVGERYSNDVTTGSIEHKMGINGSATAVLNFGEEGKCRGELVGTVESVGIKQMFLMMNHARIGVGLQSLGVMSSAFLNALEYAQERKQGPNVKQWKNPEAPKVPIIEHPDVRRMLLDMKARVEGLRALIYKLALHTDRERAAKDNDEAAAAYHKGQVDLLVPLAKAYGSDQAFEVAATAIQVFGGAGYLHDHPVEQYCRDAKIFSIYEGTNHIQAMDLVGRKLGQKGGANFQAFAGDIGKFVAAHKENPELGNEVAELGKAMEALTGTAMRFLGWFQGGQMEQVPLAANRFLEMMSETCLAWLLLDGAVVAQAASADLADGHPDKPFYAGKVASARYFARNVLPAVKAKAEMVGTADTSPMDIPDAAFGAW